jgi:electron transport complex protein RnfG
MQPKEGALKRFYPVILLTIVILISVILLSFTNSFAAEKIQAQADAQTKAMLVAMFPDMTDYSLTKDIYVVKAGGKNIGYAFIAVGKGYGGAIQILVGLQDANTIKGISIISQKETAGLGSRVTLPQFTNQFASKNINDVKIKSEGGAIDGITGSTVSSKAVINAVRETALEKVKQLSQ